MLTTGSRPSFEAFFLKPPSSFPFTGKILDAGMPPFRSALEVPSLGESRKTQEEPLRILAARAKRALRASRKAQSFLR